MKPTAEQLAFVICEMQSQLKWHSPNGLRLAQSKFRIVQQVAQFWNSFINSPSELHYLKGQMLVR
jgi:hypothetical protein